QTRFDMSAAQRPTPLGLAQRELILTNTPSSAGFEAFDLGAPLQRALSERGFTTPTPIQAAAIPQILEGRDLIGLAQTGTGKTAAFVLPLAQNLADEDDGARRRPTRCSALILAPTRELAVQIHDDVVLFGGALKLKSAVILGGVARGPQERALAPGVDVVVGTPGRILDLLNTRHLSLEDCTDFILDEADQMLDLGFIRDVQKIARRLPTDRQTLMFSATWPSSVADLADELLTDPVKIRAGEQSEKPTPERIAQQIRFVGGDAGRPDVLRGVFDDPSVRRAIVFTRTKRGANKVAEVLERAGVNAAPIHGNKSQNARQRALDAFKSGELRALVATDIAARGIDAPNVSHVVNYDMPTTAETYVHRIGRTARAGKDGLAISICGAEELSELNAIERLIGFAIPVVGDAPRPSKAEARAAEAAAKERRASSKRPPRRGGGRDDGSRPAREQPRQGRNRRGGKRRGPGAAA
ncbi:MAG: DEAD/DEAH box helicase, partial [Pseudomonadota bacterium]